MWLEIFQILNDTQGISGSGTPDWSQFFLFCFGQLSLLTFAFCICIYLFKALNKDTDTNVVVAAAAVAAGDMQQMLDIQFVVDTSLANQKIGKKLG